MMRRFILILAGVLSFAGAAHATVIFSDNFDSEPGGTQLNYNSFANWNVLNGTVDLIASGGYGISCVGAVGKCVDLDGSTGNGGELTTKTVFNLTPGDYALSFDMSGNQRGGSPDSVLVTLGSALSPTTFSVGDSAPFTPISLPFSLASTVNAPLVFHDLGTDNVGAILDNVVLERRDGGQIPEPATLGLFGAGLLGLGLMRRRRR